MGKESFTKIFGFSNGESKTEQVRDLNVNMIKTNPFQPRKHFDPVQLEELSKSIKEHGLIQPIIVRAADQHFELVAGERRLKAAQSIGMKTIPAIVRNLNDKEIAEIALIENLQREDLDFFEEAEGYKRLIQEFSLTQEEIAKRVGKSQSTVANKMRILKLPESVRNNITTDVITERHARALLKLPDPDAQNMVLKEIYDNELNVRETDQLVEKYIESAAAAETASQEKVKRIVRVFRDMRIYINTIKSAISAIEETGQPVKMTQTDQGEYLEVVIQLPKTRK